MILKNKIIKKITKIIFIGIILLIIGLVLIGKADVNTENKKSIFIYEGMSRYLALAVYTNNTTAIEMLINYDKELLNAKDETFDCPILLWAVGMSRYESTKTLLELGADVNCRSEKLGYTPILMAAGYSWVGSQYNDTRFLKLIIDYGGNVNDILKSTNKYNGDNYDTPLLRSFETGIDKTKLLVESGADLNYKSPGIAGTSVFDQQKCVSYSALLMFGPTRTKETYEWIRYIIIEKHADSITPYKYRLPDNSMGLKYPVEVIYYSWDFDHLKQPNKRVEFNRYKEEILNEIERQANESSDEEIKKYNLKKIQEIRNQKNKY